MRTTFRVLAVISLAILATLPMWTADLPSNNGGGGSPAAAPNIVVIVADDVGWGETSFDPLIVGWGADDPSPYLELGDPLHELGGLTPNIGRIANEGIRLTRFYVAPYCKPSRQMLYTGRYPHRWGQQANGHGTGEYLGMPREETILPETLRRYGYTSSVLGKWQMGTEYSMWHPIRAGFDEFLGNISGLGGGGDPYCDHTKSQKVQWMCDFESRHVDGTEVSKDDGWYHTEAIGSRAEAFIYDKSPGSQPYYLHVNFFAAHNPQDARADYADLVFEDLYKDIGDPQNPGDDVEYHDCCMGPPDPNRPCESRARHLAQIKSMDDAIGGILEAIDTTDPVNTVVLFISDNGGVDNLAVNNPLQGGKFDITDGGVRVPAAIRYPALLGHLENTTSDALFSMVDVFPTLQKLAADATTGTEPEGEVDGNEMVSTLVSGNPELPKYHFVEQLARTAVVVQRDCIECTTTSCDNECDKCDQRGDCECAYWKYVKVGSVGQLFNLSPSEGNCQSAYPSEVDLTCTGLYEDFCTHLESEVVAWLATGDPHTTDQPDAYTPNPHWDFFDEKIACDQNLAIHSPPTGQVFCEIDGNGSCVGSQIPVIGTVSLKAIGMNTLDERVYGFGVDDGEGHIYLIARDEYGGSAGFVLDVGMVHPAVSYNPQIDNSIPVDDVVAADVHPGGKNLYVMTATDLYDVELEDLTSTWLRPILNGDVGDIVFQDGELWAYDNGNGGRVMRYDSTLNLWFEVATCGLTSVRAVWPAGGTDLVVLDEAMPSELWNLGIDVSGMICTKTFGGASTLKDDVDGAFAACPSGSPQVPAYCLPGAGDRLPGYDDEICVDIGLAGVPQCPSGTPGGPGGQGQM